MKQLKRDVIQVYRTSKDFLLVLVFLGVRAYDRESGYRFLHSVKRYMQQ